MARPTKYNQAILEKAEIKLERELANYTPITESGCWIYLGSTTPAGYGSTKVLGKTQLLHRLMFARANGYMPYGEVVRHKCDVTSCINPEHLIAGTQQDNINDMIERGRGHWQN